MGYCLTVSVGWIGYSLFTVYDSNDKKEELIRNFYIPNTKEDIYEFFILAASNITADNAEFDAWSIKLEHAYLKAKLAFGDGKDFKYILRF